MPDIGAILEDFNFADTIEHKAGKLSVTLAEAHAGRNRAFGRAMLRLLKEKNIETSEDFTDELEIDIFCECLLKRWDAERDGEPIPLSEAADVFKGSKAGLALFKELGSVCAKPEMFRQGGSKKKRPSATTRKPSRSATKPATSRSKRKPAAKPRRPASKPS